MISTRVFQNVRDSVCAIVIGSSKLWDCAKQEGIDYQIIGTGFLATENLILTNRHVFNVINEKDSDFVALVFVRADSEGNIIIDHHKIDKRLVLSSSPIWNSDDAGMQELGADIALLELNSTSVQSVAEHHKPVTFTNKERIQISIPIGICGYIYGNKMLGNPLDPSTIRYSPTLLQGHIAGLSPFDNLHNHNINLILTDLTTGGGLSGSPLFTEDGEVIGIHCAGMSERVFCPNPSPQLPPVVKLITHGIGFAVPITQEIIEKLIKGWNKVLVNASK